MTVYSCYYVTEITSLLNGRSITLNITMNEKKKKKQYNIIFFTIKKLDSHCVNGKGSASGWKSVAAQMNTE